MPNATTEAGFRGPQVCSIIGITYRQLDYWARTDLMKPSISEAKGSGTQRRYSYQDLLELNVIKRLLDAGISLRSARRALDYLRDNLGEDVASADLVLTGDQAVLARSGEEIVDLLRGGQGVLNIVLSISGVKSELDAAILELAEASAAKVAEKAAPGTHAGAGRSASGG